MFSQTKYSVKHVKGEKYVVLKVTDDRKVAIVVVHFHRAQCCKFKLSSSSQLRQLNQLNQLFLNWSLSKEFNSLEDLPLKTERKFLFRVFLVVDRLTCFRREASQVK